MSQHSDALTTLWTDTCTVTRKTEVTDQSTRLTGWTDTVLLQAVPCRLSFSSLGLTNGDQAATLSQTVKLFLSSTTPIPAGSKVSVTRAGAAAAVQYKSAGAPAVYGDHQEVLLEPDERWA